MEISSTNNMLVKKEVADKLIDLKNTIQQRLATITSEVCVDLDIDEIELDSALVKTPRLQAKYLDLYNKEVLFLKELFTMKEKTKLERWKYWSGKMPDKYYIENGIVHDKILKTDIDKYLSADDKIMLVNDVVNAQKTLVDYIEKVTKEIGNRGFHIKSIIEWRKFCSGA